MSIKSEAIIIRNETAQGANTASRVGGNLVAIADDLIAKQNEINANTSKVGITTQQATDITTNNSKVGITTQQATDITTNNSKVGITTQQATDIGTNNSKVGITTEQAADIIFNSILDSSVASTEDIGGIPAGTTVGDITGDTFSSLFSNMLFPTVSAYISDASNLSIGGFNNGSLEVGSNYSFIASMSYDIGIIKNGDGSVAGSVTGDALTFNLANPDAVNYTNNSVSSNTDAHTTAIYAMILGSNVWAFSGTNGAGTTTYTNNKGVAEVVSSIEAAKADTVPTNRTLSKAGYYPLFYGMSTNDTTSAGSGLYLNSDLTKNIASTGNRSVSLNGTNEYVYFSYPSSSGALSSIIDGNGFDVTNSFTLYTVNLTSSGQDTEWTEQYNIYRTAAVTTVIGQTFDFNF
jgi:hypothetical protein